MSQKNKSFSARERISTVSFNCKYNTSFGSSLFVVGNLKLLGNWNINDAIALSTTPETYPLWTQKAAFSIPVGTELIYKYFVKDTNGTITWEELPNNANRKKIISKPGEFIIEDEENKVDETLNKTEEYDFCIKDIKPKEDTPAKVKSKKKGKKKEVKKEHKKEEDKKEEDKKKEKKKKEKRENESQIDYGEEEQKDSEINNQDEKNKSNSKNEEKDKILDGNIKKEEEEKNKINNEEKNGEENSKENKEENKENNLEKNEEKMEKIKIMIIKII
jgi:hypothetical protein